MTVRVRYDLQCFGHSADREVAESGADIRVDQQHREGPEHQAFHAIACIRASALAYCGKANVLTLARSLHVHLKFAFCCAFHAPIKPTGLHTERVVDAKRKAHGRLP
jgi:hypothetical protein